MKYTFLKYIRVVESIIIQVVYSDTFCQTKLYYHYVLLHIENTKVNVNALKVIMDRADDPHHHSWPLRKENKIRRVISDKYLNRT